MTPPSPPPESEPLAAPPSATALAVVVALALTLLAGWAATSTLDVVGTALGEVAPASRIKAVQHLEGGIVSAILIEEGQSVKKGEVLFRLDPVRAAAQTEELEQRALTLRIDIARLTAQTEGRPPAFDPDLAARAPAQVAAAQDLLDTHRRRLEGELGALTNQVTQRERDLEESEIRSHANRKTLEILDSQVAISQGLVQKDLSSRMSHLELLRQQQSLRAVVQTEQAAQPRLAAALAEAKARLVADREGVAERARVELAAARQLYDEIGQQLLRLRDIEERTAVRAPVDGVVKTVQVATEGGVIQPGQTLAELVPAEDRLVIDARLALRDIGYVHAGQLVQLTLTTPDAAAYGQIEGRVQRVSPDAILGADNHAYYRVRVVTDRGWFERKGQRYQLYPGMPLMCAILIGNRTILEYLLSPWFNDLRFAFRER